MSVSIARLPDCPEDMDDALVAQFHRNGYLAFENVLTAEEVEAALTALSEITGWLMDEARGGRARVWEAKSGARGNYAGTQVQELDGPFGIHFEPGVEEPLSLENAEAELKFRKLHGYHQAHPTFQALVEHPRIKGFVERVLGQKVVLKNEMALSKPPFIGSEKPWHQDNAYFDWLPLEAVATAWITLDDATVENGCMHVLPGRHKGEAFKHVHTIDCQIVEGRLDYSDAVPLEMKAGGAMIFSAMLPHHTPPNRSPHRRRALQFQYRGENTRQVSREEFGKVFAEVDGTPATCALAERLDG